MTVANSIPDLVVDRRGTVGFVPTMGAFHEGHLELMRQSKLACDFTVVSLFVNPTQFGKGEDFTKYPRDFARDAKMAESVGVDLMFAPSTAEMYPRELLSVVSVPEVGNRWEGEHRPGHFDGVATVVAKLFNIVRPDIAFFGRKDFQQCAVVGRMVRDLNFPIVLEIIPTKREPDGLAMSSRNAYLSQSEREVAPKLFATLEMCRESIRSGNSVSETIKNGTTILSGAGFRVDYLACVEDESLEPISVIEPNSTLICAARLGNTRLIDNLALD